NRREAVEERAGALFVSRALVADEAVAVAADGHGARRAFDAHGGDLELRRGERPAIGEGALDELDHRGREDEDRRITVERRVRSAGRGGADAEHVLAGLGRLVARFAVIVSVLVFV